MVISPNSRTSAGTGVPIEQPTLKNHNHFYTHPNEVIQKLKYSYGSLVSMKNIKTNTNPNTSIPEKLKEQRPTCLLPLFYFLPHFFHQASISLLILPK